MDNNININILTEVISSVQRVVAEYYGPQCSQTLMTSSTGKAVITSDGMTILEALQAEHPVARLVFQAIQNCHTVTKDGSKLFLLYLSNILVYIKHEIDQGHYKLDGTNLKQNNASQHQTSALGVKRSILDLKREVIPRFYKTVFNHCGFIRTHLKLDCKSSMAVLAKNILTTAMMAHYSVAQCDFYSDLLLRFLPLEECKKNLIETLNLAVDKFNHIVIKVPSRPYQDCTIFPMFLIKQSFKYKHESLTTGRSEHRTVVLSSNCFIAETDNDSTDMIKIKESGGIEKVILSLRRVVETFVKSCLDMRVDIVLCATTVPNYVIDIFRRHKISVICNVPEYDVEVIEVISDKLIIHDLCDSVLDVNLIKLSDVNEVIIGGRQYVQLKITGNTNSLKHLIVCAPTVGLCDQLALVLHKALNGLKLSFQFGTNLNGSHVSHGDSLFNTINLDKLKLNDAKHKVEMDTNGHDSESMNRKAESSISCHAERHVNKNANLTAQNEEKNGAVEKTRNDLPKVGIDDTHSQCSAIDSDSLETFVHICSVNDSSDGIINDSGMKDRNDMSHNLTVIEGGASFEILTAHLLHIYSKECHNSNLSRLCNVLEKTMLSVVQKLYENTNIEPKSRRNFLKVETLLISKIGDGSLWGLDRCGRPCSLLDKGVLEPLTVKFHTLDCVLDIISQLLSIDKIASSKKIKDD